MSTYSRYRRRVGDTVNNGVAWNTPSYICSCQWCIKSEVFCGYCWMLRRRLEAATGCRRGPQYDGKCSFYLNCNFFRTSPTNRDLREKAVYFPSRSVTRYGKNTYISRISNSVTHLQSYTNTKIANISPETWRQAPIGSNPKELP